MTTIKIRAILPTVVGNPKLLEDKLKRIQKNTSQRIRRDFEKTTRTWVKKPKFTVSVKREVNALLVDTGTDDEIYGYVTEGTRPHIIRARNAPRLLFRFPSVAKTQPNVLRSGPGKTGSQWASKLEVHHPGTEARNFHVVIAERFRDNFVEDCNRALREYLQATTRP